MLWPSFVMICCFLEKQMDGRIIFVSNHRSYGITFHQSYYWDLLLSKNQNSWTVCKENDDFIDILVWLRHPSLGFIHWDNSYLVSSIFAYIYKELEINRWWYKCIYIVSIEGASLSKETYTVHNLPKVLSQLFMTYWGIFEHATIFWDKGFQGFFILQ